MDQRLAEHYERIAHTYNSLWDSRPDYPDWMAEHIRARLRPRQGDRIVDIGVGTGLFVNRLLPHATEETPVVGVDPSAALVDQLPADPRLHAVHATAEDLVAGRVEIPYPEFDAIVIKEAVHHFAELDHTLGGLARRLAPGGRIVVVTLPPTIDYPLFPEALDRFAAGQPEPDTLAAILDGAGLEAGVTFEEFPVVLERDAWLDMVRRRWMSVLSTFSDDEIERGVAEIAERHSEPKLEFPDRFAFVVGSRPSSSS